MDRDDRCPARTVSRSKDGRLEFAAGAVFSASLALPTADGKNAKPSGVPSTSEVVQLLIFRCRPTSKRSTARFESAHSRCELRSCSFCGKPRPNPIPLKIQFTFRAAAGSVRTPRDPVARSRPLVKRFTLNPLPIHEISIIPHSFPSWHQPTSSC